MSEVTNPDIQRLIGLYGSRRFVEAEALARRLVADHPNQPFGWKALGAVLLQTGRKAEALEPMTRAAKLLPEDPESQGNLGALLCQLGHLEKARKALRSALALRPDYPEGLNTLGLVAKDCAETARASILFRRSLTLNPGLLEARENLIATDGSASRAGRELRRLIAIDPRHIRALSGYALRRWTNDISAAERLWRRALGISDQSPEIHSRLAEILRKQYRLAESGLHARRSIALAPDSAVFQVVYASTIGTEGEISDAKHRCDRALMLDPGSTAIDRTRFNYLLYDDAVTDRTIHDEARAFARRHRPADADPSRSADNDRDPSRRLRVGVLSSDLCRHPIGTNLRALFEQRQELDLDLFCYAHETRVDGVTEWYRRNCAEWRTVTGLSDSATADLIRADRIDVLIVVAGWFNENRPLVASYRAAPVQVSMIDATTSGIDGMDWFIGDDVLTPAQGSEMFVERLARLPVLYNYPATGVGTIAPRPATTPGRVTFGSFNSPTKLTPSTLALWARVLRRLPDARLLLKYMDAFAAPDIQERVVRRFADHGISADRLLFPRGDAYEDQPLGRYNQVDIVLDTHPFTGGTTTFEALWMGVPVVTLQGSGFRGRVSAAHLLPLGLGELVAETEDAFVDIAAGLAMNPARLNDLHRSLRSRIQQSPLVDGPGFARSVARTLRHLWQDWCASGTRRQGG